MIRNWTKQSWLLLVLLFGLFVFINTSAVWRWMYPVYYPERIKEAAFSNNVNPHLILAIIQTESKFIHEKTSKKGAVGLMQLMRDTADWIIESGGYPEEIKDQIASPEVNIELGSWYLRYLLDFFHNNLVAAIAAYNAGQGNVNQWISNGTWDGGIDSIRQIPFGETRHYIQRVLYMLDRYEKIYGTNYWIELE